MLKFVQIRSTTEEILKRRSTPKSSPILTDGICAKVGGWVTQTAPTGYFQFKIQQSWRFLLPYSLNVLVQDGCHLVGIRISHCLTVTKIRSFSMWTLLYCHKSDEILNWFSRKIWPEFDFFSFQLIEHFEFIGHIIDFWLLPRPG